ncbi:MAG: cation-translocating P-type ATPase C-terminal domain-containing protein [Anaerolineae bacterium]|nr:cation-translocating P-type ATPase C-terminal domain-containing protein [Anaerolineae bacterium]
MLLVPEARPHTAISFLVSSIHDLLQLAPLSWGQWDLVFAVAVFWLIVVEIGKFLANLRRHPVTSPRPGESFERKPA